METYRQIFGDPALRTTEEWDRYFECYAIFRLLLSPYKNDLDFLATASRIAQSPISIVALFDCLKALLARHGRHET